MSEKAQELSNIGNVSPAEMVVNPVNPYPSAPVLVGADADTSYVAVAVQEDEFLVTNKQHDFCVDTNARIKGRKEAKDAAETVVRTNQVRKYYLDADEEAVVVSGNSSRAEARDTNTSISSSNVVRPREVPEYDPVLHNKVGATELDYVDDSKFKTKYTVDKSPIGEGYTFESSEYETKEYKFSAES